MQLFLQVSARSTQTNDAAIALDNEYRSRMERAVSDLRRNNRKRINDKAQIIELASSSKGWQSLHKWNYASNQSIVFGRYNKFFIQIVSEKFPYLELVQDFLLDYKFDQE